MKRNKSRGHRHRHIESTKSGKVTETSAVGTQTTKGKKEVVATTSAERVAGDVVIALHRILLSRIRPLLARRLTRTTTPVVSTAAIVADVNIIQMMMIALIDGITDQGRSQTNATKSTCRRVDVFTITHTQHHEGANIVAEIRLPALGRVLRHFRNNC